MMDASAKERLLSPALSSTWGGGEGVRRGRFGRAGGCSARTGATFFAKRFEHTGLLVWFDLLALRQPNCCKNQQVSKTTKRIFIYGFVVFQLATLCVIAYFAAQAWNWKFQALMAIERNAVHDAVDDYRKGMRRVLEVKTIDQSSHEYSGRSYNLYEKLSANRQDGTFAVWYVVIPSSTFSEQAAAYVTNYNQQMLLRKEKPEWFGPDGERRPSKGREPRQNTVRPGDA